MYLCITLIPPSTSIFQGIPSLFLRLQRLEDIHAMEASMADKAGWAALSPVEQQDKKRFYQVTHPYSLITQHVCAGLHFEECIGKNGETDRF